jgi:L-lactate dehydrogenase (cytochrome)
MIAACVPDYRELARRRLPRILFDYIDGGAYGEQTLRRNVEDFAQILLRQRVMRDVSQVSLSTELFGQACAMPVVLSPVGLAGMYARRGECQAASAAKAAGVPFCLSSMSTCGLEEVARAAGPIWFQLYMIRDRGYMAELLAQAAELASPVLVFTVDLPVAGMRYRDLRSGASGGRLAQRLKTAWDGATHPGWLWDVHVRGRPHTFGNLVRAIPEARGVSDFWAWVKGNFDPSITWADLEWVRARWKGPIVIKGVLDAEDARQAVAAGADGLSVSNHGGRQLDSVPSAVSALPAIVEAVGDRTTVLMDGGVRSGLDVVKAMALGAKGCLIGRAWAWALAGGGGAGVAHVLDILRAEMEVALALTGCTDVRALSREVLA